MEIKNKFKLTLASVYIKGKTWTFISWPFLILSNKFPSAEVYDHDNANKIRELLQNYIFLNGVSWHICINQTICQIREQISTFCEQNNIVAITKPFIDQKAISLEEPFIQTIELRLELSLQREQTTVGKHPRGIAFNQCRQIRPTNLINSRVPAVEVCKVKTDQQIIKKYPQVLYKVLAPGLTILIDNDFTNVIEVVKMSVTVQKSDKIKFRTEAEKEISGQAYDERRTKTSKLLKTI